MKPSNKLIHAPITTPSSLTEKIQEIIEDKSKEKFNDLFNEVIKSREDIKFYCNAYKHYSYSGKNMDALISVIDYANRFNSANKEVKSKIEDLQLSFNIYNDIKDNDAIILAFCLSYIRDHIDKNNSKKV